MADNSQAVITAAVIAGALAFGANLVTNLFSKRNTDAARRDAERLAEDQRREADRDANTTGSLKRYEIWERGVADDNKRLREENAAKDSRIRELEARVTELERIVHKLTVEMSLVVVQPLPRSNPSKAVSSGASPLGE